MNDAKEQMETLIQELRRGTITIGVLSLLSAPQYGYLLVKTLRDHGFHVEPGTLYPLLRRLEKQGLLESEWDTKEGRPRKYYFLSEKGKDIYKKICDEWKCIVLSLNHLMNYKGDGKFGDG